MKKYLLLITGLLLLSCEWPFDTTQSDDNLYFTVSISHEITRIVDSAEVEISWTGVTIENFSKFIIERKSELDTSWTIRAEILNPAVSSYTDIINDDITFFYRVGISDMNKNIRWDESSITIPLTTKLYVPADYDTIQYAYSSPITDDGDSIIVSPGRYYGTLGLLGKNVVVKSTLGFKSTSIIADEYSRSVNINMGVLQGFLITGGSPMGSTAVGGGIYASGSAVLKNNCITDNTAPGQGGGAYITGDVSLYNNIFHDNTGALIGGLLISKGSGEIINNTFANNMGAGVGIDNQSSVYFINNIIATHMYFDLFVEDTANITIAYNRFGGSSNQDSTGNISENPNFVPSGLMPCLDFRLSDFSPCIDTGHPDIQYNDPDGTRNDMVAFGGPGKYE